MICGDYRKLWVFLNQFPLGSQVFPFCLPTKINANRHFYGLQQKLIFIQMILKFEGTICTPLSNNSQNCAIRPIFLQKLNGMVLFSFFLFILSRQSIILFIIMQSVKLIFLSFLPILITYNRQSINEIPAHQQTPVLLQKNLTGQNLQRRGRLLQPVTLLRSVKTLDTIINFIYCNKKVGLKELELQFQDSLLKSVDQREKNLQCQPNNRQQQSLTTNRCIFCKKQFKNESYLALHYSIYHYSSFYLQNEQKGNFFSYLLSQKLFKQIKMEDFHYLLYSAVSPPQKMQYCIHLMQKVSKFYQQKMVLNDRYYDFILNKTMTQQVCIIVSYEMYKQNNWIKITKYFYLFFIIVIPIVYFSCRHKEPSKQSKHKYN